ncbi:hypothetical protein ACX3O0_03200 [Homoserinimonas sp. A447]
MTAWQDLPPRTRRQARMNEREQPAAEFERAPKDSDQNSASDQTAGQNSLSGEAFRRSERSDFTGKPENAAQELASAYSRRSRRAVDAGAGDRATNDRAADDRAADVRAAQRFPVDSPAHPDARHTEFRVRDFRPEARGDFATPRGSVPTTPRSGPTRDVPSWSPPSSDNDGRLDYYTQGVPIQPTPPPAVVNSVPSEFAAPPRPMTRRQLRELEVSQGIRPQADDAPEIPEIPQAPAAAAPPAPALIVPPASAAPPVAPPVSVPPAQSPSVPLQSAPLPPAPAPAAPSAPRQAMPQPAMPQPAMPPVIRLAPPIPMRVAAPEGLPGQVSPEPIVFTDASGSAPANRAPVAPQPAAPVSLASSRGIDSAPLIFTSPDVRAAQDNVGSEFQAGDSFIRTVGSSSGSFTTSALVIPSIPQAGDITRPFSSTGEILVTGSIDLPMSLASTGANSSRFDHSDIDALFAQEDHDYAPADSAPVRAIRAVSTHTSTHGVISAKKPANNRLPMLMAVTAGILAVGVAALFAAGMIFGYF